MSRFFSAAFLLAAFCAVPAWAAPHIYYVTNPADSGANTLRQAIIDGNNLPSNDYPDIRIDLGENQPILLQSSLPEIRSKVFYMRGTQTTPAVINGLSQHALLDFHSTSYPLLQLKHMVLRFGRRNRGGCLYLNASDGLYIVDDVEFNGCVAAAPGSGAYGGAIYATGGSITIRSSRFVNNASTGNQGQGGAIYMNTAANPGSDDALTIRDTVFSTNTASGSSRVRGGGIYVWSVQLTITDSAFHDNWAVDDNYALTGSLRGGAIYAEGSSVTVKRSEFSQNAASQGGAIELYKSYDQDPTRGLRLVNSSFVDNVVSSRAAVMVYQSDAVLRNNSFFGNASAGSEPSNFYAQTSQNYAFYNNLFMSGSTGVSCEIDSAGASVSAGYNLIPGSGCKLENDPTSVLADAHLQGYRLDSDWPHDVLDAPLRFFVGSAALDAGNAAAPDDTMEAACPELDGQGNSRVVDGNADGMARCDIGAFEWQHEASLFADDFEQRIHAAGL